VGRLEDVAERRASQHPAVLAVRGPAKGPDALRLVDVPDPTEDGKQVMLDVHALGINYPDLLMTRGSYQVKPPLPFVPGSEVAGVVRWAPAGSAWNPGDRVAAFVWSGGYAERVQAPSNAVLRLPDGIDFRTGAATIHNYHTVHFGLSRRGRLSPGRRCSSWVPAAGSARRRSRSGRDSEPACSEVSARKHRWTPRATPGRTTSSSCPKGSRPVSGS